MAMLRMPALTSLPVAAACALLLLAGGNHHGLAASSDSISFSSDSFSFGQSTLTFPSSEFGFPASTISFPSSITSTETAAVLEVILPADILFDFDKADIRPVAEPTLRELAQIIREKARGAVTINGYTDAMGSDAHNQRLSVQRAAAVKAWLVAREKVNGNTLATTGFGARNPVAPNRKPDGTDDPEGRQLNRRVTVLIRR